MNEKRFGAPARAQAKANHFNASSLEAAGCRYSA
jgi:hypothetical protein